MVLLSAEWDRYSLQVVRNSAQSESIDIRPYRLMGVGRNSVTAYNQKTERFIMVTGDGAKRDVTVAFQVYPDYRTAARGLQYCDTYGASFIVDGVVYDANGIRQGGAYHYYGHDGRIHSVSVSALMRAADAQFAKYKSRVRISARHVAMMVPVMQYYKHHYGPFGGFASYIHSLPPSDFWGVVDDRPALIRAGTWVCIWDQRQRMTVNSATSGGCFVFRGSYLCHIMENMMPMEAPTRVRVYDSRMHCLADVLLKHNEVTPHYSCLFWPLSQSAESAVLTLKAKR